tara:strand:+ start:180 stop:527 length:348 start_codon:yes stop_codon:yes gene_type:complete
MRKIKRATVEIKGEEFNLTPKQLLNILSNLDYWDMKDFLGNNPTTLFNDFKNKNKIIEEIENTYDQLERDEHHRKLNQMEFDRQEERSTDNLDQSIYPHGWYEKEDNQIMYGEEK